GKAESQMPKRSAKRSRTKSNSCRVSSPNLRSSFTPATVATRCTSNTPSESRKLFAIGSSHRFPRIAVVWATTVKTSNSLLFGGGVRIRQARTFAAMPKSVIQISPGLAAGILGLLVVHLLEHRVGRFVQEQQFVRPIEFPQAPPNS